MKRFLLIMVTSIVGCGEPPAQCRYTSECKANEFCRARVCAELTRLDEDPEIEQDDDPKQAGKSNPKPKIEPDEVFEQDAGVDTSAEDTAPDRPPHPCASASPPNVGDLIINEVNANVAPGPDGDANGDGVRDAYEDEFVELWNTSSTTLRLDGVEVLVGEVAKWKFDEPYCVSPGQAFVLFARGTPNLAPDIPVVNAETRLSLSNSGGILILKREEEILDRFEWGPNVESSWVRSPEGAIDAMPIPHTMCGGLFSPGRCCDGTPTQDGCPAAEP